MMFLMIPWEVDVPEDRVPIGNWLVLCGILAAFALQLVIFIEDAERGGAIYGIGMSEGVLTELSSFVLDGWGLRGLLGHMWLHGGVLHLIGNMLFLWIFGNAVCAKIGTLRFLGIYLIFGILAAAAHLIFIGEKAIGASGAINGVVGMFLVLFPQNSISIRYFGFLLVYPFWGRFTISSIWMILFWFAWDIWGASSGSPGVAYWAHIGGFLAGAAIAVLMLKMNWVTMERYERSLLEWLAGEKEPGTNTNFSDSRLTRDLQCVESAQVLENAKAQPDTDESINDTAPINDEPEQFFTPAPIDDMIRFNCLCGKRIKIPGKFAGKTGRCPSCRKKIRVPQQ